MKKESSQNDWYKGVARELSYFTTDQIIRAYRNMKRRYGHTLPNILFHSRDEVLTMIRKRSDFNALMDYYETLSEEYIVGELKNASRLYDELEEVLNDTTLDAKTWPAISKLCEELWLYYMFGIYFGYATEMEKIHAIKEKHYDLVVKVRNGINDLQILDDFLKGHCADIDLTLLTEEEIDQYLRNKTLPPQAEMNERNREYLIKMIDLETERIPGDDIRATIDRHLHEEDLSGIEELPGTMTYAQTASGKARIVLKKEHLHKIRQGDILVTIMTDPDFVPSLSKVAGIVTDYGGITCHASIISREMKIPCIVATKHATEVFKDGDLIEIDDKKSIVRKVG